MISLKLTGKQGSEKIARIMQAARTESFTDIGGVDVLAVEDYWTSERMVAGSSQPEEIDLPQENVVKFC